MPSETPQAVFCCVEILNIKQLWAYVHKVIDICLKQGYNYNIRNLQEREFYAETSKM